MVGNVEPGDVVYHWDARAPVRRPVTSCRGSAGRKRGCARCIPLKSFVPIRADADLARMRQLGPRLRAVRKRLESAHPTAKLYLPFQFRSDGLRMISNYFAKLPRDVVTLVFDETGLGEAVAEAGDPEEGEASIPDRGTVRGFYLQPFKRRADTAYVRKVAGGVRRVSRSHETLVTQFAAWLKQQGHNVGYNAAIDLGLSDPPVIIEAKVVTTWPRSVREAVGQLLSIATSRS